MTFEVTKNVDKRFINTNKSESFSVLSYKKNQEELYPTYFQHIDCKGFSFQIVERPKFVKNFRLEIDFRIALIANYDILDYAPNIRKILKHEKSIHIKSKYPTIGFSLGKTCNIGDQKTLLVNTLQSEINYHSKPSIRSYFRGWSKVLFATIIDYAIQNSYNKILLVKSEDILKICYPIIMRPKQVPKSWEHIYDETAIYFNLNAVSVNRSKDIQLYPRKPDVFVKDFYELKLTQNEN